MENTQSPLQKYKRQPKLYIDLPSQGAWYNNDIAEKYEELEVFSMTANDEILAKTPDALISGNATVKIIQSCIPSIKNAWLLTNADFDYVMAAIRLAWFGEAITLSSKCTSCGNDDAYSLSVQSLLDHAAAFKGTFETRIEDFTFRLRPLTYKEMVENQQVSMRVRRELAQIISRTDIDQDKKDELMNSLYEQINTQTENIICNVIVDVVTPDGDVESNMEFIKDFVINNDSVFFNGIQTIYSTNNQELEMPATEVECSECQHKQNIKPNLDYSSFFLKV